MNHEATRNDTNQSDKGFVLLRVASCVFVVQFFCLSPNLARSDLERGDQCGEPRAPSCEIAFNDMLVCCVCAVAFNA